MIDFELPPALKMVKDFTHGVGRDTFRPISRKYDEEEHTTAEEIAFMGPVMAGRSAERRKKAKDKTAEGPKEPRAETEDRIGATMTSVVGSEELAWGDSGLMLVIPGSGLRVRDKLADHDARKVYEDDLKDLEGVEFPEPKGCLCHEVLRGLITSDECPLFGKKCTPRNPIGPCMVSVEGSCNILYKYGKPE